MLALRFAMTDETQTEQPDQEEGGISFLAFVMSLAHTVAVHFGDVPDPVSGQTIEPNLPAAQQMIDILAMLETKTRGNLTPEERQVLEQLVYELRMRFLEISRNGSPGGSRIIIP